jgi:cbb3-type cytochrome c oxidase subunit III
MRRRGGDRVTKTVLAAFVTAAVLANAAVPSAGAAAPNAAGAKVFANNCAGCHGANGAGVPGLFPSLAANPYVSGDPKRVIHTVKFGLTGKIVANGKPYDGVMPPWEGTLSDADIANVISYVRSAWGNRAAAVTVAHVRAVKK